MGTFRYQKPNLESSCGLATIALMKKLRTKWSLVIRPRLTRLFKFLFTFDYRKSLLGLPVFWITTLVILGAAATNYWIIYSNESLELCGSSDCYAAWYETFKIPIWISALALPIIGLLAANHRSVQTAHQIDLAASSNNFSNFLAHRNQIEAEILASIEASNGLKLVQNNPRKCYEVLFPKARDGLIANIHDTAEIRIRILESYIGYLTDGNLSKPLSEYIRYFQRLQEQCIELGFEIDTGSYNGLLVIHEGSQRESHKLPIVHAKGAPAPFNVKPPLQTNDGYLIDLGTWENDIQESVDFINAVTRNESNREQIEFDGASFRGSFHRHYESSKVNEGVNIKLEKKTYN